MWYGKNDEKWEEDSDVKPPQTSKVVDLEQELNLLALKFELEQHFNSILNKSKI